MKEGEKVELVSATTFRGKTLEAGLAGVLVEPSPGGSRRVAVDFGGGTVVQWPIEAASNALRQVDYAGAVPEKVVHPPGPSPLGDLDLDLEGI